MLFGLVLCLLLGTVTTAEQPPDVTVMKHALMYSYAASCRSRILNWTCYWCNVLDDLPKVNVSLKFESNGQLGTYGFVGVTRNYIVVSFRSTQSIENILTDLDVSLVSYPGAGAGFVHQGFYLSYLSVKDILYTTVQNLTRKYPRLPVLVTGHSLGAAQAVICAVDLVQRGAVASERLIAYNFGQPRVGNLDFATYHRKLIPNSYRVVNKKDPIPHFPSRWLDFSHSPTELWFADDSGKFATCDDSGEDPYCSNSIWTVSYRVYDHQSYLGYYSHSGEPECGEFIPERWEFNELPANKLQMFD